MHNQRKTYFRNKTTDILKKSTLNPNIAQNYRPITLSSIHTTMVESLILPDTDLFDTQFGFRENRGTAFACNLQNDITNRKTALCS